MEFDYPVGYKALTFNKNKSCIETKHFPGIPSALFCLIRTRVVLKHASDDDFNKLKEFNKNKSCIETKFRHSYSSLCKVFNKNKSCIETREMANLLGVDVSFNKNKSCIETYHLLRM